MKRMVFPVKKRDKRCLIFQNFVPNMMIIEKIVMKMKVIIVKRGKTIPRKMKKFNDEKKHDNDNRI